jgi:hypothetical protein
MVFLLLTFLRLVKNDEDLETAKNHVAAKPCVDLSLGQSKQLILRYVSNHNLVKILQRDPTVSQSPIIDSTSARKLSTVASCETGLGSGPESTQSRYFITTMLSRIEARK